jgi:hypothetical protein
MKIWSVEFIGPDLFGVDILDFKPGCVNGNVVGHGRPSSANRNALLLSQWPYETIGRATAM